MFWAILELLTTIILSGTTMPDFPVHHSPGNWRPIILEVSSSSDNVSQKGAKFEEDPRTYSLKASRIVSPTFGILDDRDGDSVSSSVGSL